MRLLSLAFVLLASTSAYAIPQQINLSRPTRPVRSTYVPSIVVSISPSSVTLNTGQTQQFTAAVTGTANTAVTWQVNGIIGGLSTYGYISTGLYTAPSQAPSNPQVTVTVFSQADPSKTASAVVTIQSQTTISVSGNWQITATSAVLSGSSVLVGNIAQSGSSLSGAMHLSGSDCYVFDTPIPFTGTLSGNNSATMTTSSVLGQVITASFTVAADENSFSGTYHLSGGCGDGDYGTVYGNRVQSYTGTWKGTFYSYSGPATSVTAYITQSGPYTSGSHQGLYWLTGTVTFTNSVCFSSGTIGTNLVGGGAMAMDINTNDYATVSFIGSLTSLATANAITGSYTIAGGSCSGDSGTGSLSRQ